MTQTPFDATVHTQADLEALWRRLMEPLGFAGRTLWMLVIGADGQVLGQIVEITDMPASPGPGELDALAAFLGHLGHDVGSGIRVAFLFSRPGAGATDRRDRAWARALLAGARRAGVPCETVHVANDERLAPVPPDDLVAHGRGA
jgi:hypothetical protein